MEHTEEFTDAFLAAGNTSYTGMRKGYYGTKINKNSNIREAYRRIYGRVFGGRKYFLYRMRKGYYGTNNERSL